MYSGNIYSKSVENHVFIIHTPFLRDRGIGSFSLKGFEEFKSTDFAKDFGDRVDASATNPVEYAKQSTTGLYKMFVEGTGYEERSIEIGSLVALIKAYEDTQTSGSIDKEHATGELQDIIESVDSEVTFGNVTCHIYDIGTRSNARTLSNRGAPMITDTPRRKTGARYDYSATKRLQKKEAKPKLGTYVDIIDSSMDLPERTVTAPLKISYNEALGCYESSNQLLARLITDLNPAAITAVSLGPEDLEGRFKDDTEFYTPSSERYMGQFSTGLAIPLSVKDGNPNAFGPNFSKVEGEHLKMEAIRVVNRSDNTFDQGQVVLCTMIDGEWIAQQFAGKMELPPDLASVGGWAFAMFVANSQQYFIDQTDDGLVTPGSVFAKLKARFFSTAKDAGLPSKVADLNGAASPTLSLSPYAQFTSLDLMNGRGGHSSTNYVFRSNVEVDRNGGAEGGNVDLGLWWGPNFPDGFTGGDGGFQLPADAGILGDYPDSANQDKFPIENHIAIVRAVNDQSNMAKLCNNIIMGRLTKNGRGCAYWYDAERGVDGNFVGSKQYPIAVAIDASTTPPASSDTSDTTDTTDTTEDPGTTETSTLGPALEPPVPSTTPSPDITTSTTSDPPPPPPEAPTTTPEPIMDFPEGPFDTAKHVFTSTTVFPAPSTPAPLSTTHEPFNQSPHPRTAGYITTSDPKGNVNLSDSQMNDENLDKDNPLPES